MGNPSNTDRRFDKPAIDALVDLLNASNKSHIRYGEITADRVTPLIGFEGAGVNTSVRIRLTGSDADAPTSTVTYSRLSLDEYVPVPALFTYAETMPITVLFDQLRLLHGVVLSPEDSHVSIDSSSENEIRYVTFIPRINHLVWRGSLTVETAPLGHLRGMIPENEIEGFMREAVVA